MNFFCHNNKILKSYTVVWIQWNRSLSADKGSNSVIQKNNDKQEGKSLPNEMIDSNMKSV